MLKNTGAGSRSGSRKIGRRAPSRRARRSFRARRRQLFESGGFTRETVAVLMGGVSRERGVSLKSGKAVVEALRETGREVVEVLVNRDDIGALENMPSEVDTAFIALHGRFGEDGGVQRQLARRGIPFTGAGPEASALAFDKVATKRALREAGLPVAEDVVLHYPWTRATRERAIRRVEAWPVVVKPATEGSSIGVSVARDESELRSAIDKARCYGDKLLLERYIGGREMTVPVFAGLHLPIVETETGQDFFTYYAKYQDTTTVYTVAPTLAPCTEGRILKAARRAHEVIGCDPFSRVDIRVDDDGRPWILEVNTIPGLTATSLLPKAAAHCGITFSQLCGLMVEHAAVRVSDWSMVRRAGG